MDVDKPEEVNTIKRDYDIDRSKSKAVSFALQYAGTWHTLVNNSGFEPDEAKDIVNRYHEAFKVSLKYTADKLEQASHDGYVTVAFGLRVRTPILGVTLFNTQSTPYAAQAEGRSAGNALSQSYGLLNCRAANEFMRRVRNSKYKYDIKICAQIHDAIYLIIRNKVGVIHWANKNLTNCMEWSGLVELQHPTIKLNAELSLFYPSWNTEIVLEASDSKQKILERCKSK